MAVAVNLDKMEKLPDECRFFDVNEWWYFPNRWAVSHTGVCLWRRARW